MILYLDASALVKRYIVEEGRDNVLGGLNLASLAVTSTIVYAEVRSAFARRRRDGDLDADELALLVSNADNDWNDLNTMYTSRTPSRNTRVVSHRRMRYAASMLCTWQPLSPSPSSSKTCSFLRSIIGSSTLPGMLL